MKVLKTETQIIFQVFGVSLSLWNKLNGRKYAEILLEFIPQLVFLVFIFCYLIFLIFFKWVAYYADTAIKDSNTRYSQFSLFNYLAK